MNRSHNMLLQDKIAIITGAADIGLATVKFFLKRVLKWLPF
ncbi:MAG: hypothetical protein V7782_11695 [Psychromonas sp.]